MALSFFYIFSIFSLILFMNFAVSFDVLNNKYSRSSNLTTLNITITTQNAGLFSFNKSIRKSFEDNTVFVSKNTNKELLKSDAELTDELFEEDEFDNTRKFIFNFISGRLPPLNLTKSPQISLQCRRDGAEYLRQLSNMKLWAVKMYDASAKLPSGILSGNINQYGDFDECVGIHSEESNIDGKYCLAYLQIDQPKSERLRTFYSLMYSHFPFRSTFNDPGHRVPRLSSISWAFCVPSSCSSQDIQVVLREMLKPVIEKTGISIQSQVDSQMCQVADRPIPLSTIIGGIFFISYVTFTLMVTLLDYLKPDQPTGFLMAFSLKRNIKNLISLEQSSEDIACVHGIRFLNAFMLLMAHKSMAVFFIPYVNRTQMAELLGQPWTVLGRAASLYTDPFIMFSGMLTAYSLLGRLKRGKTINIVEDYISRLLRIVPPLAALILFCTVIAPWTGSGPQWNLVVTHYSNICKSYWWRNLLFIHNYFGFENMCLTHTHHVGIDTQLFFLSPLFVWIIWKWQKRGIALLLLLATWSTFLRYYNTYTLGLSNYVHYGATVQQLFKTANNMYILPSNRLTVYLIGVIFAYMLRMTKTVDLKQLHLNIGNATAIALFCAAFFGPAFMGNITYKYQPIHAAWYAAFAPIAWCLSFAWLIYTAHYGYYNILNRIFSSRLFLISTRLSYAVYLTQFPIFFYNVGVTRNAEYYNFFKAQLNILELAVIILFSVILTLLFDSPFQHIRKLLFKKECTKSMQNGINKISVSQETASYIRDKKNS